MRRSIPALLIVLLLSACGGDSARTEAREDSAETDGPLLLEVTADDFSFDLSDTARAGPLEIRLENAGIEPHQALIYKLNEGVDYEEYLKSVLKDDSQFPALSVRVGGVNYGVPAGETETYEESDPYEPGTYALVCFIKDSESGKNHYELGMIAPLTVE